jgi:hypothetical protein
MQINGCAVNMKEGDHLENLLIEEIMILKWIIKKQCVRLWTGFSRLSLESKSGALKADSNEPSTSVKKSQCYWISSQIFLSIHTIINSVCMNSFGYDPSIFTSFPSYFHTKILREFLFCSTRATYLILFLFISSVICLRAKIVELLVSLIFQHYQNSRVN